MFCENEEHRQQSFFSGQCLLPERLRERLYSSWAETFYQELFCRIDETLFAPLYSEEASRPNVPVNVLMGLGDLRIEIFTLRSLYNFRRRVREYAEESGVNLIQQVFEQVTDEQLEVVKLTTGWQRMDSTQVLSNLAKMTRLELLVTVLQAVHQELPESMKDQWAERWARYLEGRPHQVCWRIPPAEVEDHLVTIGQELWVVGAVLAQRAPESAVLALVERVLKEQYEQESDGKVKLRPPGEIGADSLQSPHDPDATYRVKGGTTYSGGYVVNVSETADPQNPVQLITDVQVEPNRTDDSTLLEQSLEDQAARGVEVSRITADGGYTGPRSEAACGKHGVVLRATRMRGGQSPPDHWGWAEYTWEVKDDGVPVSVTCPQDCTTALLPGRAKGRFLARFDAERCAACPFFKTTCRVEERKLLPPTLYVTGRQIKVALRRQHLHPEDASIRTVVESTVRSLKRAFPGSKLPVRRLIRARMMLYPAAMMVNLRRLHRHFARLAEEASREVVSSLSSLKNTLRRCLNSFHRHFSPFLFINHPPSTAASTS